MKSKVFLLVILIIVISGWYTWGYFKQSNPSLVSPQDQTEGVKVLSQRSKIDPSTFTRADTLAALAQLEGRSTLVWESPEMLVPAVISDVPEVARGFILPGSGEKVELKKATSGEEYYTVHYFSEIPVPENQPRFLRLVKPGEFKLLHGFRNNLAATIELESKEHYIRISQLVVSEERTEVMVYIKGK